jgi:hypothetical protein
LSGWRRTSRRNSLVAEPKAREVAPDQVKLL